MKAWSFRDIPDQTGRTAIVTGANSGIGLETARMLAKKGAHVVLACRNPEKGRAAVESIESDGPAGRAVLAELDLSDLDSVAAFAMSFAAAHDRLDLLIDNAGVMVPPFSRTAQGFELQFGTNHLGHFALTARLMPLLLRTKGSRVTVVSSTAHNIGKIDFDDPNWNTRPYRPWPAYGQSKLANLLFARELDRRLVAARAATRATAAHPGWTATDLQRTSGFVRFLNPVFAMKPPEGALPTLRAATDPSIEGGTYWGPSGLGEMTGPPVKARVSKRGLDDATAARLFDVSEELTGVSFRFETAADLRKAG
jgi:NAD(P)-dependent dehydrogenase (short-subunit alcohol dehydrogenase family)